MKRDRSVSRAAALALLCALAVTPQVAGKDCGERPTGKNPDNEELLAAVEELSLQFQIPVEIILAVGWRESGLQQWRSNGALVVNEKDCGLGMMQLTGSTAELFDVPRLKADWRYNLECGVNVLQRKWRRAEREKWKRKGGKLPAPDRAVLENWYYALSYYQGRRTGEYPGKVFDHLRKRPGKLRALLPEPIEVSNPDEAIEGFSYGMGFTALRGNRVVLEDGRTLKIRTTVGTIGNPELLAHLEQALARAERDRARGRIARAVRWYRRIAEAGGNTSAGRKAKAALAALEKRGAEELAAADALREQGDITGALERYGEIEDRYDGLAVAETAAERAEAIRSDPSLAERAERLEHELRARRLLAAAERMLARDRPLEALRKLRYLVREHEDTEAAALARDRIAAMEADRDLMAKIERQERARELRRLIALADNLRNNEMYEQAIRVYEQALALDPPPEQAAHCREGLRLAREAWDEE
ncbi:MAG: hypothetical protein D6776_06840 [Planctomycetota bacterium]|nr:MAG: hypothetical protein D6776_06840 [Planctomycetota bacterium]